MSSSSSPYAYLALTLLRGDEYARIMGDVICRDETFTVHFKARVKGNEDTGDLVRFSYSIEVWSSMMKTAASLLVNGVRPMLAIIMDEDEGGFPSKAFTSPIDKVVRMQGYQWRWYSHALYLTMPMQENTR